jgi:outer membrane protein OmpA-like peptidoglycan-associated protein
MNKYLCSALVLLLGVPAMANAAGHVRVGGGFYYGYHGYHGPRVYYYAPYYGYYGLAYYYGPGYYYPPPSTVYAEPETTVVQPPANYWYYCPQAKAYYPYVNSCPSGWEAVPAQAPPQSKTGDAAPAPAKATAPPQTPALSGTVVYRFGDLLFASGQASLQSSAQSSLATMLSAIKSGQAHHITIEGHTDSSGDAAANHELSKRRAEAVKQFLIEHGVPADSINTVGKGADAPIGDNSTPEGRKMNRRVDVIVG